jgi:hypothetical protein
VRQESKEGRHKKKDTNREGLVLEDILKASDAVLQGRTVIKSLKVEEEAWVANTVAIDLIFKLSRESFKTITNQLDLSLIIRILCNNSGFKCTDTLVAVPEIVEVLGTVHI